MLQAVNLSTLEKGNVMYLDGWIVTKWFTYRNSESEIAFETIVVIVTITRQFTELENTIGHLISTRIKPLATFFQDYNVVNNSSPENIRRVF